MDVITEVNLRICELSVEVGFQVATRVGPSKMTIQTIEASPFLATASLVTSASLEARASPIGDCCHSLFHCFFPFYLIHSFISVH